MTQQIINSLIESIDALHKAKDREFRINGRSDKFSELESIIISPENMRMGYLS